METEPIEFTNKVRENWPIEVSASNQAWLDTKLKYALHIIDVLTRELRESTALQKAENDKLKEVFRRIKEVLKE